MIKKLIYLLLLMFLVPRVAFANSGAADSPWPVFGHDRKHTLVSPYEIGKEKKNLLWSYKAGSSIESSPVIGEDGTIYVGSHDGYFYAFNKDGSVKWKNKLAEPVYDPRWNISKAILASPAIASDGTIYINGASGYLHAFNPDGTEKWKFKIKWHNDFWNGPNIGKDGTIYIGAARKVDDSEGSGLYAINPDGTKKWFVQESSGITVVPSIADDGTIIYGSANPTDNKGRVKALTPDGKLKWEFVLKEWLEGPASIGSDGTIFTGSKEGDFYALTPEGKEKWHFATGGGISAMPTIGNDGNVYIGSWDGNFYAFNQNTGQEKWRFDVKAGKDPKLFEGYPGKETIITSAALSKDGIIIFGDVFDTIYAVDTSGKELWRWNQAKGGGFGSSPAIGSDGTIYIGDEGGYFYALGDKEEMPQTNNISNNKKYNQPLSTLIIIFVVLAIIFVISTGIIYILYRKQKHEVVDKKPNIKTLLLIFLTLSIIAVISILILLVYPSVKDFRQEEVQTENQEQKSTEKEGGNQYEDEFTKNAVRIPGPIDLWVREFGETGRSCLGDQCSTLKDTCVRWNKTKDECYEMIKTSPAESNRYKIYCNMVIVNQDREKRARVSLNLNYTTADETVHFVQKDSYDIEPGSGKSLLWTYDVDKKDINKCSYSDLEVK